MPSIKQIGTICFAVLISIFSISSFADNITTSPADCTQPTLSVDTGTANLNAQWEANTIGISWYNDGQKITGDATAATQCTYDHTFSLPTQPTKTGYTFTGWKVVTVPSGYTALEYIASDGNQYIDTGYTPNQNTEIIAKTLVTTTDRYIYGVKSSGNSTSLTAYVSSSGYWRFKNKYVSVSNSSVYTLNTPHDSVQNSSGVWIDDTQIGTYSGITSFTAPYTLILFGANGSSISKSSGVRIYSFTIKENGTVIMNLIPAKSSSDVLGMFDTVSGTFFTNGGSGTFTAGPEVN